jgi:uncharacterized protein HemX
MTTGHKLTVGAAVLLAVLLGIAGYAYVQDKVALARHEEQTKADSADVKTREDANRVLAERESTLVAALEDLKRAKTTTQIVQAAPQVIQLPAPVKEVTAAEAALPNSPVKQGDLVIPQESVKPWFDAQVDCKANSVKLDACQQTAVNDKAIIAVKDKQIAEDQVVIKGGTKWQRFGKAAKWTVIGVGIGVAVGVVAEKH